MKCGVTGRFLFCLGCGELEVDTDSVVLLSKEKCNRL